MGNKMVCWFVFHFILVKGDWDGKEMVLLRESDGELGTLGALMALSKLYLVYT